MMTQQILYIHGKGGNAEEAAHYRPLFPGCRVIGFDYRAQTPWEASDEFPCLYDRYCRDHADVTLIANSIGAYFARLAFAAPEKALFVSPIVDMERLICDRICAAGITEQILRERGMYPAREGDMLSWDYLCWVRAHPAKDWYCPQYILYGENDSMTDLATIRTYTAKSGAELSIVPQGEHWFHTPEQLAVMADWERKHK